MIQQTPSPTSGWSQYFTKTTTIAGFIYDLFGQKLYVPLKTGSYTTFTNVPVGVAQAFTYTPTPDTYYTNLLNTYTH